MRKKQRFSKMEADEDDMVVVIIGNDDENALGEDVPFPATTIKQEVFDDEAEEALHVEQLLQTAEKHGQHIDMKNLDLFKIIKDEPCDYEYLDEFPPTIKDTDEDYVFNECTESDDDEFLKKQKEKSKHRVKMLTPSERHSYVAQIRKEKPEFDTEELIRYLTNLMKSLKPPAPPPDFYRVNDLMFECIICNALTYSLPAAARHYQDKHGPRYLICFACGVDFRSHTNLYKHEKRCNAPDAKLVLQARARMVGRKGRHRPYMLAEKSSTRGKTGKKSYYNKDRRFKCSNCTAQFRTKIGLTAHTHLHRGERPYACDRCAAAYTTKSALYRHSQKHTDALFICDHCGRNFKAKTAIIYHMDTHLPQRKHACPYKDCSRRFAQKYALTIHIKGRHQNLPPPCACQICPRRFTRMSLLKVHMKKEHGMILMTRNMFFKRLPTLSDTQVQQAKVIFNDDDASYQIDNIEPVPIENDPEKSSQHDNPESITENSVESEEDILKYVQNLLKDKASDLNDSGSVIVIENGEVTNIGTTTKFRKEYEKLFEDAVDSEVKSSKVSMPEL